MERMRCQSWRLTYSKLNAFDKRLPARSNIRFPLSEDRSGTRFWYGFTAYVLTLIARTLNKIVNMSIIHKQYHEQSHALYSSG